MLKKPATDALLEITPPAAVSAATLFGMSLESWVLYATLAYAVIRLLLLLPRLIGCGRCFLEHHTCTLRCRDCE